MSKVTIYIERNLNKQKGIKANKEPLVGCYPFSKKPGYKVIPPST